MNEKTPFMNNIPHRDNLHIHCPHFAICSGCSVDENIDQLAILDEARRFFADKGVASLKFHVGNPHGWRCRAKLAVRGSAEDPHIGLFEEGSHRVVDIPQCRVHHPAINQAVFALGQWMVQHHIAPYDEVTGKGLLRYVQLAVERKTGKVQVALVLNQAAAEPGRDGLVTFGELWKQHPDLWHSLWLNFNIRRDNVIFGTEWIHVFGSYWLWETLRGCSVCFHPASFVQANLDMFERLLDGIEKLLPSDAEVVEFYAGVGAIGFAVGDKCRWVKCVELNPQAEQCFLETRQHLPEGLAQRLSIICGKSADSIPLLKEMNPEKGVIIVDPPRKGLESMLLDALCESKQAKKLIYISCGWPAFQRDCNRLLSAGWRLTHAEAYLFFPGNEQLEILAAFE